MEGASITSPTVRARQRAWCIREALMLTACTKTQTAERRHLSLMPLMREVSELKKWEVPKTFQVKIVLVGKGQGLNNSFHFKKNEAHRANMYD